MNRVCLDAAASYAPETLLPLIEKHFAALAVDIRPGMTVVIKPNLIMRAAPESGIITHPNLVAAVGLAVQARGAKVLIAESSGGPYTPAAIKAVFSGCGYIKMAEKYGFALYTQCKSRSVQLPQAEICHRLDILEPFLDADYIIDVAKLKSHCMTMLSGAVKNLFGVVPGLMKPELHCRFPDKWDFSRMLVDLCQRVRPNLSIIDAIDAMEGDGPTGGSKRFVGALISSCSPYAADTVAAAIIGMEPQRVFMLKSAAQRGLCPQSTDQLEIVGDSLQRHLQRDFKQPRSKDIDFISRLPAFMRPLAKRLATPLPVVRKSDCVGCGKCAESCPQHTIDIKNGRAKIQYDRCIHCFCCHEMCPVHVIDVKRFSLFKL